MQDYDALAMQSLDAPRRDSVVRSHSAMRLGDFAELVEQEKSAREQEEEEDDFDLFCKQAGRRKLSSCADWGGSLPDIPKATSPSYSLAKTLLKKRLHAPLTRGSTTPTRSKSMRSHSHKSSSMHGKLPGNVRNFIDKYDKALDGGKDCHSVPNSRSGSMRRLRYQKYHDNNSSGSAGGGSGSRPDSLVLPDDIPDDHYLVRQFVTTRKGVVNRGDSIRSCSTSSVRSAGSAAGNGNGAGSDTNDSDASPPAAAPSPLTLTPVKDRFKVLILGPRGVGKTTLIKQFQSTECSADADPVFEDALSTSVSVLLDAKESTLDFIDIPSDQEPSVREAVSCYLVVFSIADKETFHAALDTLFVIRGQQSSGFSPPIILVANKTDLVRTREVSTKEGKNAAEHYHCKYTEASASMNMQVDDLLAGILKQIRLHKEYSKAKGRKGAETQKPEIVPYDKHRSKSPFALMGKFLKRHLSGDEFKSCDNLMVL